MIKEEPEADIPERETAEQARKGEQDQSLGASPNGQLPSPIYGIRWPRR